jgi:hypothetical protein
MRRLRLKDRNLNFLLPRIYSRRLIENKPRHIMKVRGEMDEKDAG